jgi:kumamolisin
MGDKKKKIANNKLKNKSNNKSIADNSVNPNLGPRIFVHNKIHKYILNGPLDANYQLAINLVLNRQLTSNETNSLRSTLKNNNISIIKINQTFIQLFGPHRSFTKIFGFNLNSYTHNNVNYYSHSNDFTFSNKYSYVQNVLGLDNFARLASYVHVGNYDLNLNNVAQLKTFTPIQVAELYKFPTNVNGKNQTIGIIELGGGYNQSDLTTYFNKLNLNPVPKIIFVSVDNGNNVPGNVNGDSAEVVLDIEISGSIANAATIVVYFAPNTTKGFYDAIYAAINDSVHKPSIISISWGSDEKSWSSTELTTYNNLLATAVSKNINIFVAAGDSGSSDGAHGLNVDFPGSSPNVICCGGTTLISNGTTIENETVWNNSYGSSGGGISNTFAKPSYQNSIPINTNKRCVPDVVANADPNTGYTIYMNNTYYTIAGTSAVAPLMAGLMALVNQNHNSPMPFINNAIYLNKPCIPITSGNNGAYVADPTGKYNCASGNGRINGLLALTKL